VPDSRTAALLGDLGAVAQEIGRLRWTLAQVVMLAEEMPKLTDVGLRAPGWRRWPSRAPVDQLSGWAISPLDSDVATGEEIGRLRGLHPPKDSRRR
jgi:hypothetical protein